MNEGPDVPPQQRAAQQRHRDLVAQARELLGRLDAELGRVQPVRGPRDEPGRGVLPGHD